MIVYEWRPEYADALQDRITSPSGRLLAARPAKSKRVHDRRDHDPGDEDRS